MNRRDFLSPSRPAILRQGVSGSPPEAKHSRHGSTPRVMSSSGLEPYTGPWGFDQAIHLLRRTMFGATKKEIDALASLSMQAAVDMLLASQPEPVPPVVYYRNDPGAQLGSTWVDAAYASTVDDQRLESVAAWWVGLVLAQPVSIVEKMTLFLHNHFVSASVAVKDARFVYRQLALLRRGALGNFKELARDVTLDPAMLRYLNGNTNTKESPNENYARELQELFTIGKGPEISAGNYTTYTEEDVQAAARVLTGWSDNAETQRARFTPSKHDSGDKHFSSAYGNLVIRGGSDEAGARRELDDLLGRIFAQQATAKYICRKLYIWFVDYVIDEQIERDVIEPMAAIFRNSNYELKPVLEALFKSAHFYDARHVGSMIKNPFDFALGTLRLFGVELPGGDGLTAKYYAWIGLRRTLSAMGMTPYAAPNVAGWPAYWQEPSFHELWINADTLQKRIKYTNDLAMDGLDLPENNENAFIDVLAFAREVSDPSNPRILVEEWARLLFPIPLTDAQKELLNDTLLPGLPDYEWTAEWSAYMANPSESKAVEDKLRALLRYMLAMAEYQLS